VRGNGGIASGLSSGSSFDEEVNGDMPIDWSAARYPVPSMLDAIGRTPLIRLSRVVPEGLDLLVKIEWYGPTGSVKDRIYRHMLDAAERRGRLRSGMHVIEATTGNAGIACAAVSAIKGYPCTIVLPAGMSDERRKLITAYGADLVLTPGGGTDIDLAIAEVRLRVDEDPSRWFWPAEFENPDNVDAQRASGEEIWEQSEGRIDAVVAGHGTGGWITGVARALKLREPRIRAYAVEPAECALLTDRSCGTHGIAGIGDGIVPRNLDLASIDGVVTVSTDEALRMARRLGREEGILGGPSSGCNVAAALKLFARRPELRRIVTVVPDTAQRYFSDALFGDPGDVEVPERDHRLDDRTREELDRHADRLEVVR
jgi:cysteine synthase